MGARGSRRVPDKPVVDSPRRPRSSGDRAPASGAGCAGSNPAGGTGRPYDGAAMSDPRAMHAPSGFHHDQPLDRDDLLDDPIEQFRRGSPTRNGRRPASERDGAGDRRRDGQAVGASRAAARRRRARLRVLHEPGESQGPTDRRDSLGGARVPLEGARPSGGGHRGGRPAARRRVRRVLREPAARRPARRVGIAAERHDRRTRRVGGPPGRGDRPLPRRCAAPAALGRLRRSARDDRVLAGPAPPAARPVPLHGRVASGPWQVDRLAP